MAALTVQSRRRRDYPSLLSRQNGTTLHAYDYTAVDDHLTQPACRKLNLSGVIVDNAHGVTVRQLYEAAKVVPGPLPIMTEREYANRTGSLTVQDDGVLHFRSVHVQRSRTFSR
jgi:hypothetical protein